jgi:hypothetical protein
MAIHATAQCIMTHFTVLGTVRTVMDGDGAMAATGVVTIWDTGTDTTMVITVVIMEMFTGQEREAITITVTVGDMVVGLQCQAATPQEVIAALQQINHPGVCAQLTER